MKEKDIGQDKGKKEKKNREGKGKERKHGYL